MFFQHLTRRGSALRAGLILLLLTGTLAVVGCGTQMQNALKVQENLNDALHYAQVDPTDTRARQSADLAIAVAPLDPETYFGSRTPNSNDPFPQLSIYSVFDSVGDNSALADYMAQAVQKFPSDERGYQFLSEAQQQLGRTAAEKVTATQLAALLKQKLKTPGATDIESLTDSLAQAYFDSGDPVDGAAMYKKAIQAYPTHPTAFNNLAYAEAVSGTNLPEALTLAHQAIALAQKYGSPDDEIADYEDTLGWVQYQQGRYPAAEQSLLQAANVVPRLPQVRYHLGLVYAAEGNMDAARVELGHAVLLAQGYAAAQQALSTLPKSVAPKVILPKPALPKAGPPKTASISASV